MRLLKWLVALVLLTATVDAVFQEAKRSQLVSAVRECGGKTFSIPVWPFGAEYRIRFNRRPDADALRRLGLVDTPRGSVAAMFVDCDINADEARTLRAALPRWNLFQVVDGERRHLPDR
jgi:hypothetical protein